MATATITSKSSGITNLTCGSVTSDGTAITVTLGFTARKVKVINLTDTIVWEKLENMSAAQCLKSVTAGTLTVDTGSAIVINSDKTITISATAAGTAKSLIFSAEA